MSPAKAYLLGRHSVAVPAQLFRAGFPGHARCGHLLQAQELLQALGLTNKRPSFHRVHCGTPQVTLTHRTEMTVLDRTG